MGAINIAKNLQKNTGSIIKKNLGNAIDSTKQLEKQAKGAIFPVIKDAYNTKSKLMKDLKANPLVYEVAKGAYEASPNSVQTGLKYANKGLNLANDSVDQYGKTKKDLKRLGKKEANRLLKDLKSAEGLKGTAKQFNKSAKNLKKRGLKGANKLRKDLDSY
jgi:hypothetical protein